MNARILVAGIGNIFLGDDAFGVEVANLLLRQATLPPEVQVVDFGIRGLDLTYALLKPYETVILIDAAPRGSAPGTLYVIEPTLSEAELPGATLADAHDMNPLNVLRAVRSMGGTIDHLLVVGCEPTPLADVDDMQMGLSPAVETAVGEAVKLVESLVRERLKDKPEPPPAS